MTWTADDRQHLAELCREHDRMMAEHAASERARERAADDELVPKMMEDAMPPVRVSRGAGLFADPDLDETFTDTMAHLINELRDERDAALKQEIAALQQQWQKDIDSLQGRLMHMIARFAFPGERAEEETYALGNRLARMERQIRQLSELETRRKHLAHKVVELPNWRKKRDVA